MTTMKKKILIIVSVFSLLAVAGGAYLMYSIGHSASGLNDLIMFQEIELKREQLLLDIHQVQEDLHSQSTRYPVSVEDMKNHAGRMEAAVNTCFGCHHKESVMTRLSNLRAQIDLYNHQLESAMAHRTDAGVSHIERERAKIIGTSLINNVNTMIVLTSEKLNKRRDDTLRELNRSGIVVIVLVVAGPLMVALFAFTTLNSFAKPIQILLAAVKRLKAGDLDSRVTGMKDEFAELADSFNDMAQGLRDRLREIAENERRYRLLFESAADAIFILDTEGDQAGNIVTANHAAAAMHGYTVEELIKLNIRDIDAPEASQRVLARIERMMKGEWIKTELDHVKKDGTIFPVEISAGVFEFSDHRYILAIDRDITERWRTEEALQRAEQIRTTGELAAGLAHEIKNPLAGIKATMETLAEEPYLTQEDRGLLFKVVDEIKRIDGLIKGLLNFARPPRPQFMATDVNAVLDAAAQLVLQNRPPTGNGHRTIDLVKDLAAELPEIIADPMQLKQVFMNLLMNAADSMPDRGTVVLKTSFDDATCSITAAISDTGKGMTASVMDRIFQPFFTTKSGGTGLGLAISKRLIEEQGGRIAIDSSEGRGTTFSITLPCDGRKGRAGDEG